MRRNHGETLAQAAVSRGSLEHVRILAEQVQDMEWNVENGNGESPLMIAMKRGKRDVVKLLLKLNTPGVNINTKDKLGNTLQDLAETKKQEEIIDLLRDLNSCSYGELRDELIHEVGNQAVDLNKCLKSVSIQQKSLGSRRRLERLKTVKDLIQYLENRLLILPDKGDTVLFFKIVASLKQNQPSLISKLFYRKAEILSEKF